LPPRERNGASRLAITGAALIGFGWWGVNTAAGRARFDEMAGMIPFGAQVLGGALLLVAAIMALVVRWRMPGAPVSAS
jgi:hypothetical protein